MLSRNQKTKIFKHEQRQLDELVCEFERALMKDDNFSQAKEEYLIRRSHELARR
jgi:hypothetical protein